MNALMLFIASPSTSVKPINQETEYADHR